MMDCNSEFKDDTQTKDFPKKMRVNIDSANSRESEFTVLSPEHDEHDSPPKHEATCWPRWNPKNPTCWNPARLRLHGAVAQAQPDKTPWIPQRKPYLCCDTVNGSDFLRPEVTPLLLPYWMYITVVFNFWFSSGLIQICFISFIGAAPDKHHGSPCQNYQTNSAKSLHIGSLHCFRGVCLKMRGPIFQRNAVNFFLENPSPG